MIYDYKDIMDSLDDSYDICIIGSGAAGLTLACAFLDSPEYRICILESGDKEHNPRRQALCSTTNTGLPYRGAALGRFRVVGGATTMWPGQCLPLFPIDMVERDWVSHSGWPISYEEMQPYYEKASTFLSIDSSGFGSSLFNELGIQIPFKSASTLEYGFSKWLPTPNMREFILPKLKVSGNVDLIYNANVTKLLLSEDGRGVQGLNIAHKPGCQKYFQARVFILCTGGIENARILLASNDEATSGIGNAHDLVGRFLQDHPHCCIGSLIPENDCLLQRSFNLIKRSGHKYAPRINAAKGWQSQQEVLNMSANFSFNDQSGSYEHFLHLYKSLRAKKMSFSTMLSFFKMIKSPFKTARTFYEFTRGHVYVKGAEVSINVLTEQEPSFDSRVSLSHQVDEYRIPKANIHWGISDKTFHSVSLFAQTLQAEFRENKIGELQIAPWLLNKSDDWRKHFSDIFHHIGTTRMSNDPQRGVVDQHCRVHDVRNLYVAGSSVFPTGGHSNPTFTIVALALRLAEKIKSQW